MYKSFWWRNEELIVINWRTKDSGLSDIKIGIDCGFINKAWLVGDGKVIVVGK